MASEAYSAPSKRKNIDSYRIDQELSDDKHAVYHNPDTGNTVLAYRGTVATDLDDLRADAALSMGLHKHDKAFKKALERYQQVRQKYGNRSGDNIHLTGHSLGGAKVHHVLLNSNNKTMGTTFNPGATPFTEMSQKAKNFTVVGDPISNSSLGANTVAIKPTMKNPHTINNFTGGSIPQQTMANGVLQEDYKRLRGGSDIFGISARLGRPRDRFGIAVPLASGGHINPYIETGEDYKRFKGSGLNFGKMAQSFSTGLLGMGFEDELKNPTIYHPNYNLRGGGAKLGLGTDIVSSLVGGLGIAARDLGKAGAQRLVQASKDVAKDQAKKAVGAVMNQQNQNVLKKMATNYAIGVGDQIATRAFGKYGHMAVEHFLGGALPPEELHDQVIGGSIGDIMASAGMDRMASWII